MWQDLKDFALRGNAIDMAIGIIVGAAFGTIVQSLVDDVLMPPVGLLLGNVDFGDLFLMLKSGADAAPPYATLAEAQSAGAVTLNYGSFINNIVAFAIVTFAMFFVIRLIQRIEVDEESEGDEQGPNSKDCPYCFTEIPLQAVRCPNCTSELQA